MLGLYYNLSEGWLLLKWINNTLSHKEKLEI